MGLSSDVRSFAVMHDDFFDTPGLYVGGTFVHVGGVVSPFVARWDGVAWFPMIGSGGSGLGAAGNVDAMASADVFGAPALFAGGSFTTADGVLVNNIAMWNGVDWFPLNGPSGTGVEGGVVLALAVFDEGFGGGPALYVGGTFSTSGGFPIPNIAKWNWNSDEWLPLVGPDTTGPNDFVYSLVVFDDGTGPALYAGGIFTKAGGVTVNSIAKWDGSEWSPLSGPSGTGLGGGSVSALTVFDDGDGPALYAGGTFTLAGGVTVNRVAKWNGTEWSALSGPSGTGVNSRVHELHGVVNDTGAALYAGGLFTAAGGMDAFRIARWDGVAWSTLDGPSGTGTNLTVRAIMGYEDGSDGGPVVYVGGSFVTAGGITVNRIAKWHCAAPDEPCPGDTNGDGVVDFSDLSAVLAAYGWCVGDDLYNPDADLDGSGCVDFTDLSILLVAYGEPCE